HGIPGVCPSGDPQKVTLDMLQQMPRAVTITLLDAAMATKDDRGKVHIKEPRGRPPRGGGWRGAVAGFMFGLIYPPSFIASAAAGGIVGALAGRARDSGI